MTNEENLNELNLCSWFSNILRRIFITVWKCHRGINIRNEELPRVVFKWKATSITEYKQSLYFVEWFWPWVGCFLYFKFSSTEEGMLQSRLFFCVIMRQIWKNKTSDFKDERRKGLVFLICGMGGWPCRWSSVDGPQAGVLQALPMEPGTPGLCSFKEDQQ